MRGRAARVLVVCAVLTVMVPFSPPVRAVETPRSDLPQGTVAVREVWVKPVVTGAVSEPNMDALLRSLQRGLDRFTVWSNGELVPKITRVAPVVEPPSQSCHRALENAGHPQELEGQQAPEGVHVLTAVFGPCYTTSLAPAGVGSWLFVAGLDPSEPSAERTVVHEFGHNLGLGHANAYSCFAQSSTRLPAHEQLRSACRELEYGDASSVMGSGLLSDVDDLGAPALHELGWLPAERLEPGAREVLLPPYAVQGRGKALLLPGGYLLSYRVPDSSFSFVEGAGVFVHDLSPDDAPPPGGYLPRSRSVLLPMTMFLDGAQPGMHVVLPRAELAFRVESFSEEGAVLDLKVGTGRALDSWGPAVLSGMSVGKAPSVRVTRCEDGLWRMRSRLAVFDPSGVRDVRVAVGSQEFALQVPSSASQYPVTLDSTALVRPRGPARVTATDSLGNVSVTAASLRHRGVC